MPVYRMPTLRTVTSKAWFRIREFIFEAWPLLIIGSVILAGLKYYSITPYLDKVFQPFTWALGLPSDSGYTAYFWNSSERIITDDAGSGIWNDEFWDEC